MRKSGRSTRIIDDAIQELFRTGKCTIIDHHGTRDSSRYTFDRLIQRLLHEHDNTMKMFIIDGARNTIKLKDFKYEE